MAQAFGFKGKTDPQCDHETTLPVSLLRGRDPGPVGAGNEGTSWCHAAALYWIRRVKLATGRPLSQFEMWPINAG
jgi:hypothetical protein